MVMIGIDPHKRTHTAVAVMTTRSCSVNSMVHACAGQSLSSSRGLINSIVNGRGRSSRRVGSAICSLSSSWPPVKPWWTFLRCWRRGCGCWGRAAPRRTIRTTLGQSRSQHCARRCWCQSASRITRRCCVCWHVVIRRSRGRAIGRCVAFTLWSVSSSRAASSKQIVARQAFQILEQLEPVGAVGRERHRLAFELLDDIDRYDEQRKTSERRIHAAVAASGTTLTEIFGIGDVVAATMIGHTGDVARFANRRQVRRVQRHRADRVVVREPEAANASTVTTRERTMNHALHIAAVTQLRHAHSPGRSFFDRKRAEGHTSKSAIRALKRRISNTVLSPPRRRRTTAYTTNP